MLSNLTIARSATVRTLILTCALVTALIMIWAHWLGAHRGKLDLSYSFYYLFTTLDYSGSICGLLILLGAMFVPGRIPSGAILRWIGRRPIAIATSCTLALSVGTLVIYRNHPLSMDEYAAYFQSQIFSAGHLAGKFPVPLVDWLLPVQFQNQFLVVSAQTGAVASPYWPSFALLLAPFMALGIPWACNPAISGLTVIAVHRLALTIFDDVQAAGAAVLLTIASPVFFANGISYYSMPAHLLANAGFMLLLLRPTPRRAFAAGIIGSIALTLHNPFPHAMFALPWIIWIARRKDAAALMGSLMCGYAPLCLVLGLGWFEFAAGIAASGDATSGIQAATSGFTLPSISILIARLIGLAKIWVWGVPGLMILAGVGAWKWRDNTNCRLLLACSVLTYLGYLVISYDQGHGWGYRYFHSAWMALPLLAAGVVTPLKTCSRQTLLLEDEDSRSFLVGCALLSLVIGVGFRAWQIHDFVAWDLGHDPITNSAGPGVEFLNANSAPYEADLIQNDPWLRGGVLKMISRQSTANAQLMSEQFPDMHLVYEGVYGEVWTAAASQSQ